MTIFTFNKNDKVQFILIGNVTVEGYVTDTYQDGIQIDDTVYIPEASILFFKFLG